jgi:hypothetical protein
MPYLSPKVIVELVKILRKHNIDVLLNAAHTFNQEWIPSEISDIPRTKVPSYAPVEFIEFAGFHIGTAHGLTQILANYRTKAKLAVVADLTKKFIVNNGTELSSEKVLLFKNSAPQDINNENDYSEFSLTINGLETFYRKVESWLSKSLSDR